MAYNLENLQYSLLCIGHRVTTKNTGVCLLCVWSQPRSDYLGLVNMTDNWPSCSGLRLISGILVVFGRRLRVCMPSLRIVIGRFTCTVIAKQSHLPVKWNRNRNQFIQADIRRKWKKTPKRKYYCHYLYRCFIINTTTTTTIIIISSSLSYSLTCTANSMLTFSGFVLKVAHILHRWSSWGLCNTMLWCARLKPCSHCVRRMWTSTCVNVRPRTAP